MSSSENTDEEYDMALRTIDTLTKRAQRAEAEVEKLRADLRRVRGLAFDELKGVLSEAPRCADCKALGGSACPGCGKVVCEICADSEGEFCCDGRGGEVKP